jgi:hypothetical protein
MSQKFNSIHFLQTAGFEPKYAQSVGIAVDHRRTNKSEESLRVNVDRLKEYKNRLVVFTKKGAKKEDVPQLTSDIIPAPAKSSAVSFVELTEVIFFSLLPPVTLFLIYALSLIGIEECQWIQGIESC